MPIPMPPLRSLPGPGDPSWANPSRGLCKVSPYPISAASGTANWGLSSQTSLEFLLYGNRHRILQTGTITRAKAYIPVSAGVISHVASLVLKIWRWNGSTFNLVATSEDIHSQLVASSLNTFKLAGLPVQEGDFLGVRMTGDGGGGAIFIANTGVSNVASYYYYNAAAATDKYDWLSKTSLSGYAVALELYDQAPTFAAIGDSVVAGRTGERSLIEDVPPYYNQAKTISRQLAGMFANANQQCLGVSGQKTADIAARITDATNSGAAWVILEGGLNDLLDGTVTQEDFIGNMTTMMDAAIAAKQGVIVLAITPWTDGTTDQMQARDAWNIALRAEVAKRPGAIWADAGPYVGQFRSGGDDGNLWDIKPICDDDDIHLSTFGYGLVAQAIHDAMSVAGAF